MPSYCQLISDIKLPTMSKAIKALDMVGCSLWMGRGLLPWVKKFKYLRVLFMSDRKMEQKMDRWFGTMSAVMQVLHQTVMKKDNKDNKISPNKKSHNYYSHSIILSEFCSFAFTCNAVRIFLISHLVSAITMFSLGKLQQCRCGWKKNHHVQKDSNHTHAYSVHANNLKAFIMCLNYTTYNLTYSATLFHIYQLNCFWHKWFAVSCCSNLVLQNSAVWPVAPLELQTVGCFRNRDQDGLHSGWDRWQTAGTWEGVHPNCMNWSPPNDCCVWSLCLSFCNKFMNECSGGAGLNSLIPYAMNITEHSWWKWLSVRLSLNPLPESTFPAAFPHFDGIIFSFDAFMWQQCCVIMTHAHCRGSQIYQHVPCVGQPRFRAAESVCEEATRVLGLFNQKSGQDQ